MCDDAFLVLATTDDVIHPLLFACESRNPALVQIALSSLQKPIQYNAIPEVFTGAGMCLLLTVVCVFILLLVFHPVLLWC